MDYINRDKHSESHCVTNKKKKGIIYFLPSTKPTLLLSLRLVFNNRFPNSAKSSEPLLESKKF